VRWFWLTNKGKDSTPDIAPRLSMGKGVVSNPDLLYQYIGKTGGTAYKVQCIAKGVPDYEFRILCLPRGVKKFRLVFVGVVEADGHKTAGDVAVCFARSVHEHGFRVDIDSFWFWTACLHSCTRIMHSK